MRKMKDSTMDDPSKSAHETEDNIISNSGEASHLTEYSQWQNQLPAHLHTGLDPNTKSIRLLEISPGYGHDPIKCTLSQHSLDDTPSYRALSYTWDQDGLKKYIECDGMGLEIGENLWDFLCEFRRQNTLRKFDNTEACQTTNRIWVDAICIDQTSLKERNQQVAQMRDIYVKAESVIVWLGLARGQEELAFVLTRYPNLLKVDEFQTELLNLLNKPYWTRIWVIQEFLLARSVAIWCGEHIANAVAFDSIWRQGQALPGYANFSRNILESPAWPLFRYRREFHDDRGSSSSSKFRLRDLLVSFHSSRCSEVFDKIYGFLGIALNTAKASQAIHPDYSKAPVELLVDVLRNQCLGQGQQTDHDDHNFLSLLLRMLNVSRIEFARYLLQKDWKLEKDMYVLVSSGFTTPSLSFLSQIVEIGPFEHVNDLTPQSAKVALSDSSAHLRRLSNSSSTELLSVVARPEGALCFEFDHHDLSDTLLRIGIQDSTHSILQCLSPDENSVSHNTHDASTTSSETKGELSRREFLQLLSDSFTDATEFYHRTRQEITEHRGYWYRNVATFVGTNELIGAMCAFDDYQDVSDTPTFICTFEGSQKPDKALIIQQRDTDEYIVAGVAIIATSRSGNEAKDVTTFLKKILRRTKSAPVTSTPRTPSQLEASDLSVCFHSHLSDLMELHRCGFLDESQLQCLLEHSLGNESNDQVHKCTLGSNELPELRFAAPREIFS